MSSVLRIGSWSTVDYPEARVGCASISKRKYESGYYLMEGTAGYELVEVLKSISITCLEINGSTVMVDDPLHWLGMQKLAEHCFGKVLVAGLGLGLVVHHLAKNPLVKSIDVVEFNSDVIELVKPLLPKQVEINVFKGSIYDDEWRQKDYDSVILDIWVKTKDTDLSEAGVEGKSSFLGLYLLFKVAYPNARVFVWGSRDPEVNPAVVPVSKAYLEMVKAMDAGGCIES